MAKTLVADIIVPTIFEKYAIEKTAELSRFGECGIVQSAPEFDDLAGGGGQTVNMPFWQDLTATRQILSGAAPLTVNKITGSTDIARIQNDAQVWSVNVLAKLLAGDDPMRAIGYVVAAHWARTDGAVLVSCPTDVVGAAWMAGSPLTRLS